METHSFRGQKAFLVVNMPGRLPAGRRASPIVLLFLTMLLPNAAWPANHFIVPGGNGTQTGADWNNAMPNFPVTGDYGQSLLVCGDTYFVAGGTYDYTGSRGSSSIYRVFTNNCTAGSPVYIYKAVDCTLTAAPYCGTINPASVAGWVASDGTSQAVFSHSTDTDPELQYKDFITICGNYYTIDGVTPLAGNPVAGGQGIAFRSANKVGEFINISSAASACNAASQINNVTINHVEFNGVDPHYGVALTACQYNSAGTQVTWTLASAPAWVVGDMVDVQGTGPSEDFNTGQSGNGVAIQSITGNTIVTNKNAHETGQANESCTISGTANYSYMTLNYTGSSGMSASYTSETFDQITVMNSWFHDLVGGAFGGSNGLTVTFSNNYVARNRSTFTEHENGFEFANGGSFSSQMGPFTVANNIWEDIEGTMVAGMLGNGTLNGFNFYNNVVFCTSAASSASGNNGSGGTQPGGVNTASSPQCGVSQVSTDDNGQNTILNAKYYGNTLANVTASPMCGFNLGNAASTGDAENNLFWNCYSNIAMQNAAGNFTNAYNTVLADASHNHTCAGNTNCSATGDSVQSAAVNPFVDSLNKNFQLSSETVDPHLNDGTTLASPFNLDILGNTRGADGTWERGAYEFSGGGGGGQPNPPTNLNAIPQ
jgi:hypothetical protein